MTKSRGVGKARGGDWRRGTAAVMNCVECGAMFMRAGRRQKYCSPQCQGSVIKRVDPYRYSKAKHPGVGKGGVAKMKLGMENPAWTTGSGGCRRYKKDACERCGSTKFLCLHHIDRDRSNNVPSNWETLCKSCHQKEHEVYKNFTKPRRAA